MANKRKSISKKLRFEIFKRDSFTCQYCGSHPPQVILHVDHIIAVAEGGENDIDNLITSCESCNLGKGARKLSDIPVSLQEKSKIIAESEQQIKGYNSIIMEKKQRIETEAWLVIAALENKERVEKYNSRDFLSVTKFLEKLSYVDVLDAAEIAYAKFTYPTNSKFKYFCGICWGKIRKQENGAI